MISMSHAHSTEKKLQEFHTRFILLQDNQILGKLKKEVEQSLDLTTNRIFTSRDMWVESAKKSCATYTWGGNYTKTSDVREELEN